MCKFFSAVVTPQRIFFSEDWSHSTVKERLGLDEEYVDVEYDKERGLELHEPFQLPEWFDIAVIAPRCKALYEGIEGVESEFQSRWDELDAEFVQRRDELDAEHDQRRGALDTEFERCMDALKAEFEPRRNVLKEEAKQRQGEPNAELKQCWAELNEEFKPRRNALVAKYGRNWYELESEFQRRRDELTAELRQRWDALGAEYRAKLAAFEGYVPPPGEKYTRGRAQ